MRQLIQLSLYWNIFGTTQVVCPNHAYPPIVPEAHAGMARQKVEIMSNQSITFVSDWIDRHVTQMVKDSVEGDAASLAVELAENSILAARASSS